MFSTKRTTAFILLSLAIAATHAQTTRDIEIMPANHTAAVDLTLNVADGLDAVHIGDRIAFCFTVSEPGYVSLWDLGTSGRVSRIYPYSNESSVKPVQPNQQECVGNTRYRVKGPTGTENVVLYWTKDASAQIDANGYDNPRDFINGLERSAKDVVVESSWDDWATTNVAFEILNENDNTAQNNGNNAANTGTEINNIGDIAITYNNYDNVYILAFGANVNGLKKTNDDARLFTDMAKTSFNVPQSNIRLYENAYRRDFEEGIDWVRNNAGENDLVLFYYSGHGTTLPDDNGDEADGLDEAIVPYDLEDSANINNADKYIRDDEIKDWFNSINTGALVSVFDACHSGGMHKNFSQGALLNARSKFFSKGDIAGKLPQYRGGIGIEMSRDIVDQADGLGNGKTKYAMMSAAKEMEYALEIPNQGGLFTTALHDALKNNGKYRNWKEMSDILSRNVSRASQSRQTPTTIDPDGTLNGLTFKRAN